MAAGLCLLLALFRSLPLCIFNIAGTHRLCLLLLNWCSHLPGILNLPYQT
jgi:hypothetical protein